jgi:hypothetical protein
MPFEDVVETAYSVGPVVAGVLFGAHRHGGSVCCVQRPLHSLPLNREPSVLWLLCADRLRVVCLDGRSAVQRAEGARSWYAFDFSDATLTLSPHRPLPCTSCLAVQPRLR